MVDDLVALSVVHWELLWDDKVVADLVDVLVDQTEMMLEIHLAVWMVARMDG